MIHAYIPLLIQVWYGTTACLIQLSVLLVKWHDPSLSPVLSNSEVRNKNAEKIEFVILEPYMVLKNTIKSDLLREEALFVYTVYRQK